MLSKSMWEKKCFKCIWANMVNVEIRWDFDKNKKTGLKLFAAVPNHANYTKWTGPVQSLVKIGNLPLMMDDWTIFVLRAGMKSSKDVFIILIMYSQAYLQKVQCMQ